MAFGPVNIVPAINENDVIGPGQIGKPGGVATLDENGKLSASQIPKISMDSLGLPVNFDDLLAWPGCTRITAPSSVNADGASETVERWVDAATKTINKAKRVTVKNAEGDYTQTYTYYAEDGTTEKYKYIVQTTKDGETSVWTETVTKQV